MVLEDYVDLLIMQGFRIFLDTPIGELNSTCLSCMYLGVFRSAGIDARTAAEIEVCFWGCNSRSGNAYVLNA